MTDPCHSPEDIGLLADLPQGDARLAHLEACPRCQSLLIAYREFLQGTVTRPGADPTAARRHLESVLAREILDQGPGSAPPRPVAGPASRDWLSRIRSLPGFRPLATVAATLAVVALTYVAMTQRQGLNTSSDMRAGDSGRSLEQAVEVLDPSWGAAGDLTLEWRRAPDVDGYQVEFLDAGLTPLHRLPRTSATLLTIGWRDLPPSVTSGARVYWRVLGLQGGRETTSSDPRLLTTP